MAKGRKQVAPPKLRKPPAVAPPPDPAHAERFVRGEAGGRSRKLVEGVRVGPRVRLTVYLSPELHQRLAIYAVRSGKDKSAAIAEALEDLLRQ